MIRPAPFAKAQAMMAAVSAAIAVGAAMPPLERSMHLNNAFRDIGPYRSRGKGRGTASRNYMRPYANSVGGDGLRERTRRCVGGFARVQRDLGLSSRAAMDVIYLTGKRAKYPQSFRALEKIVAAVEAARG